MPSHAVDPLSSALQEMLKDPEVISRMKNSGLRPTFRNAQEVKDFVAKRIIEMQKL